MKKFILNLAGVALAATVLLFPLSASAATTANTSTSAHNGFYFNLTIGPASNRYEMTGSGSTLEAQGAGADLNLRLGYAITGHLIVAANLGASATVRNVDTTLGGQSLVIYDNPQFTTAMLGAGITYYTDNNWLFGIDVGSAQIGIQTDSGNRYSEDGLGVQVRFGKEWQIGNDWGLGFVVGVRYASADANIAIQYQDNASITGYNTVYFDHAQSTTSYVDFSMTFN